MPTPTFQPDTPELTRELADDIAKVAWQQLETSRNYKRPRLAEIRESEDLYFGIVEKQLKNPFNISFPFMSGFVDHFLSKIDDPPQVTFEHQEEADLPTANRITAAWKTVTGSSKPHAKWKLKDRLAKKLALFSGRGIYKMYGENQNGFKTHLDVVDHYNFHCDPNGGGILEDHLFCGEENIFKTKEDLQKGAQENYYDELQISKLVGKARNEDYREVTDEHESHVGRQRALGLDPVSNNYTGQTIFKLAEWYLTYKGIRWYCLFDDWTGIWVRIKPLAEVVGSPKNTTPLFPIVSWATHEESSLFWSKAPADDARPIAKYINRVLNQELYSREKQNKGQRAYDASMVHDVEALADWRPDGLVPVDTKNGTRSMREAFFNFEVSGLNGSIDLVQWLDAYVGRNTGNTPGSQGAADKDKKVGVFFGELNQIDEYIGVRNKSYTEAWEELGLRFIYILDEYLTGEGMAIKVMGTNGVEWDLLTKEHMRRNRDLDITVKGGSEEEATNEVERQQKMEALGSVISVNPRWRDEQILRNAGYDEDEVKQAFNMLPAASQELLAEAAQAIQDIIKGREVKLNQGANAAFMQKIIDKATDIDNIDRDKRLKLIEYAVQHAEIAALNEARQAADLIQSIRAQQAQGGAEVTRPAPRGADPSQSFTSPTPSPEQFQRSPEAAAKAAGGRATARATQLQR